MTRFWLSISAVVALAACDPQVPDSGSGVGFGDYDSYRSQQARSAREAQLSGQTTVQPPVATATGDTSNLSPVPTAAEGAPTAAEINAALGTSATPTTTPAPATATRPVIERSGDISDEQDFQAVSSRESIESDAERLRQQRAQYQQVQPTALPSRPSSTGPNIVQFALNTSNQPGEQIYRRVFTSKNRHARACAAYPSPSEAQVAFLAFGGPDRDRKGLDPDGDGFACTWDPRPFRAAGQN